ncbi:hypothetical protein [Brevibacillus sp. 179-C9.3 HS]|uniref:hypothetical protein n=1 Tax=unclassified Brevibacillus TaxID=2684853 RepID=UPI0039A2BDAD
MNDLLHQFLIRAKEERGATMITVLFFLFCLGSLLSILLFLEQTDYLEMKMQHTADLVTKGARAAGKWEYIDSNGDKQVRLFATKEEADQRDADIIRGAREEAGILWRLNSPSLEGASDEVSVIHQKGERSYLYLQGIYHLEVEVKRSIPVFWDELFVKMSRVSQSGVYD